MSTRPTWTRIENWLSQHAPAMLATLNPPATEAEFKKLEKRIGAALPPAFREVYSIHNGQNGDGFLNGEEFLSIERIIDEWEVWKDLLDEGDFEENDHGEGDPGVRSNWWNPLWIPVSYNGAGDHLCVDLDPDEGGQRGQLIQMWHDDSPRTLVAAGLAELFATFANELESGEWVFVEDEERLARLVDVA